MRKVGKAVVYLIIVTLSIVFLFYGNHYTKTRKNGIVYNKETEMNDMVFATVTQVSKVNTGKTNSSGKSITFTAHAFGGRLQNQDITGMQTLNKGMSAVSVGDRVILLSYGNDWVFQDYYRFDKIAILGAVLIAFLLLFGGRKGFNTILSLVFTCFAIFFVFVPSIEAGFNIYHNTVIICFYIILMTFFIVYGINKKRH